VNLRLFELILAVKRKCQGKLEQIQSDLGLSQAEFNGLVVLNEGQEILGCEFADRMGLSPSRGSRVLSRLLVNGYVKTRYGSEDRRTIFISLTAKGKRMRGRISERMAACENRIRGGLKAGNIRQIRDSLEMLEAAL
jgi:DNA-binding MarR family transcriptional regulator